MAGLDHRAELLLVAGHGSKVVEIDRLVYRPPYIGSRNVLSRLGDLNAVESAGTKDLGTLFCDVVVGPLERMDDDHLTVVERSICGTGCKAETGKKRNLKGYFLHLHVR